MEYQEPLNVIINVSNNEYFNHTFPTSFNAILMVMTKVIDTLKHFIIQ